MPGKTQRSSNLELLRILCMLLIIGDHLTGQGGIADYTTLPSSFAFCLIGCGSRIACSVFILIGGWFLCEQPYKTRRPLSLWLSLWLYTVPVTLLCRLAGLDVSFGALRWAAFPASTRQLWFISDYLLLLLCVPLLNRVLRGLPRTAHRGLLAVLAVPMILYPTLFGENGIVSDTAWMFLYEYLLAAYLRRYPENRLARLLQNRAAALALGLGLPLVNTAIRAVLETRGLTDGKAFQYVAYYRTALGAQAQVVDKLKNNPNDRRMIVSAWNVSKIPEMHLPPCHMMFQFYVANGKLSCMLYQRSCDMFLGVPFNIASYALLTMMLAQVCDLEPGEFVHTLGDTHIYHNHFEQVKEQLRREPLPLPTMKLNPQVKDINDFKYEDFTLENYECYGAIKAQVAV